ISLLFFQRSHTHWNLHSFPTRRSSDLATELMGDIGTEETADFNSFRDRVNKAIKACKLKLSASERNAILNAVSWYDETAEKVIRSEEHTSELQSRENLVCRLLLEKKKD